ncbi:hypothetical protein DUNSADRAFT_17487 [Dunaliella salina]|uniref:FF domain-containing protein n=1 Tax=Dunaliella salina TaxID=3046 RepID=A0ABQ7G1P9_DUNSA|nr:hypothetical protein DUNSADRAFT_17487 [Dunaliella salina]|eukprot:KAF5828520.1 hypothetical protein DUNSADRAFT_17487 [Dunaliella salina]
MLVELDNPPITPSSTWPRVKPQVWRDPRYLALPEVKRREIFDEVHAQVVAAEQAEVAEVMAAEQQRASQQADTLAQVLEGAPTGLGSGSSFLIEELRKEQARLRAEYDRMEGKMREMEEQMRAREAAAGKAQGEAPVPDDGLSEMVSSTILLRAGGSTKMTRSRSMSVGGSTTKVAAGTPGSRGMLEGLALAEVPAARGTDVEQGKGGQQGQTPASSLLGWMKSGLAAASGSISGRQQQQQQQQQQQEHQQQEQEQKAVDPYALLCPELGLEAPQQQQQQQQQMQQQQPKQEQEPQPVDPYNLLCPELGLEASEPRAQDGAMPDAVDAQLEQALGRQGGSLTEQNGQPGEPQEEGGDPEDELAASLLELGVTHRMLPDGTIEFSFESVPSASTVTRVTEAQRKYSRR